MDWKNAQEEAGAIISLRKIGGGTLYLKTFIVLDMDTTNFSV